MKPHKWAKEIIAWANGAEIEQRYVGSATSTYQIYIDWHTTNDLHWDNPSWEYRIKPQPKEPQYLYVMLEEGSAFIYSKKEFDELQDCIEEYGTYIGKIKLETENEY